MLQMKNSESIDRKL